MRHDPVASPQDGTPTKQVSDKTRPRNRCGSLWARMHRQDNETPALNALKALRGAPISMGRGEIPVELRPAAVVSFQKDREMVTGGDLFMKKGGKIRKTP